MSSSDSVTEANRRNKEIVFEALSKAGITHVDVAFDGEGDQGQIEHCVARIGGTEVDLPNLTLTLHTAHWNSAELTSTEMNLSAAVEHLCYGFLEDKHAGWEINEGSYGEFTFSVAERTVTLDHYGRIVETAYSTDTF